MKSEGAIISLHGFRASMTSVTAGCYIGDRLFAMGNLLRVLNDRGSVPRVDFFVDFESK